MYFRVGAAAPGSRGHPAAGLSIFAAGLFVTRDVSEGDRVDGVHGKGVRKLRVPRHHCVSSDAQAGLQVTGVVGGAAVISIGAAHSLERK